MLGLVDGETLGDAVGVGGIGVIPAGGEFIEGDAIGGVAVNLVGAHVDERRFGACLPGRLEEVQGSRRVGIEVIERNRGRQIVRGLRGGVDDGRRAKLPDKAEDSRSIPDIEFVMLEARNLAGKPPLIPAGVALGPKENGALIIVDAMDAVTLAAEIETNL